MSTLFVNPLGIAFERTDYKKRSKVRVHNNGYHLNTYRFNNIPEFKSPWISWENLDQCGGWNTDPAYLETAVHEGKKLFASTVSSKHVTFRESPEVVIDTRPHDWLEYCNVTCISRKGCLNDYYDLDAVFEHYDRLGITLYETEKALIREWCNVELSVFATEEAPFDHVNVLNPEELVTNGLLLGYPLESTASILEYFWKG